MVCATCEKKLKTLATTDPFRGQGAASTSKAGSSSGSSWKDFKGGPAETRKIGENKLLASKRKTAHAQPRFEPYTKKDMLGKGKDGKGSSTCDKCGSTLNDSNYRLCQGCAYPKGLCAMCTKPVMDTTGYRMSSK